MPPSASGELLAAQPVLPVRAYSFTNWQVNNPTAPPPGDKLDSEIDNTNNALADTIDWAATSLNTDGTLGSGTVGETQLVPGLFDEIAADAVAEVQPLVDQAQSYATQALGSATAASTSAINANSSATIASNFAVEAGTSATAASDAADDAQDAADASAANAARADNSANHADGSEAITQAYADVGMAWAEHMPDTIPPNILAVMGVTGDHWSSRWWANQTLLQGGAIITAIQSLYLGAFSSPPTTDNQGGAIKPGALYYNLALGAMFVWDGAAWRPIMGYAPQRTFRHVYLATAGQTVFTGPDRDGHALDFDPTAGETEAVYKNGVMRTPVSDYTVALNTVTFTTACNAGDVVQLRIEATGGVLYNSWSTVTLDTSLWVFNGVTVTFPLKAATGATLMPTAASDVMVSVDGDWQQAGADYTVSGSNLTFTTAPLTDARAFGTAILVGVPA